MSRNINYHRKLNSFYITPSAIKNKISNRSLISQQASRPTTLLIHQIRPDTSDLCMTISKSNFSYHYAIGRGGFGKVWKVDMRKTKTLYALKEMLKLRVISKRSVHSVMNERKILETLKNPFIVNMHFAFQDRDTLYLVLDLMEGGDLRYHIGNKVFN